jgi:ubiquinone/menaquinone biosynthesis C-methylase UbiE
LAKRSPLMKNSPNVFSTPEPWNLVAEGYARTIMHVLGLYAQEAVSLAEVPHGSSVLDVACGPGTLSLIVAKKASRVTAVDFSRTMVSIFKRRLKEKRIRHVKVHHGDGQALPFKDQSFDAAFSMFGLMFFPDRPQGFAELYRTLKSGGRAVVSSWAPVSRSPSMKAMFGALRVMNPEMPEPQKAIKSLEDPKVFKTEMSGAGFMDVRIIAVRKPFPTTSVKKYWTMMVEGSAPIVLLRKKLGEKTWKEREKLALAYLRKQWPMISGRLTSDAWLGVGVKPLQ